MELDELTNCEPDDAMRFQVLAQALSLDEACEVAFRQRVSWLLGDAEKQRKLAEKAALEWLAYVLAVHQATSGRKFKRLPRVFDLPVFRSMRTPIQRGLIETQLSGDDYDEEEEDEENV